MEAAFLSGQFLIAARRMHYVASNAHTHTHARTDCDGLLESKPAAAYAALEKKGRQGFDLLGRGWRERKRALGRGPKVYIVCFVRCDLVGVSTCGVLQSATRDALILDAVLGKGNGQ